MAHNAETLPKQSLSLRSITRISLGLFVAAIVLVVPLVVLVLLYLTEINREIRVLDRQASSIRVMQQFVALQINVIDEFYSRFYPSSVALEQFSEDDNSFDFARSRAEPITLLTTQFLAMEQELKHHFGSDFRAWPLIKERLIPLWSDDDWHTHLSKLEQAQGLGRDFSNDLFLASNLELSVSEQRRTAAQLLFIDMGQAKMSLFNATEKLAQLVFTPPNSGAEERIQAIENSLNHIYSIPFSERLAVLLGESEMLSGVEIRQNLPFDNLISLAKKLLKKKRRLQFIGALEGEFNDMGLAVEVETLRGMTWEKFNTYNRMQLMLAQFLEAQLLDERASVSNWRMLVFIVVTSLTILGVMLGTYIAFYIRVAQTQLGHQNISLEAKVKSRTVEIINAKNEAEQLNKILGKQTQISTELARKADMANSAKSLFLASMSHEIRTPLNAVLGGAAILNKTSLDSRQKNILHLITQSGKTLLDLINEILDFSKIEANQLHLESIPFNVESVLIDVVSMFSLKAKEKSIYLRLFVDSKVEGQWIGDSLRIKQIVINLLSNAIKFTHMGGISVRASLDDSGSLSIGIHDTGIGIRTDHLQNLFEAFVQSDNSTTRKYGGTGLGLSISKRLAQLHEGDIFVESTLARGSTFILTLPLQRAGERADISPLSHIDICLLSHTPELERQLRQWYSSLQVFEDINQLSVHLESLGPEHAARVVIVAESAALVHHYDQWAQEVIHHDVQQLDFPWVLLTSQDSIDCENSQQMSEELRALGANVQLPLLSSGLLIRQALEKAYTQPKKLHENWTDEPKEPESRRFVGRVLLVEDVLFNRIIACELLESCGLTVESVEDGLQAVDFIARYYSFPEKNQQPVKLILMDLHMPEMNGLDATRRIRELEKNGRLSPMPIVAMTADVLLDTREDIVQAGMNGYLPKPFEEAELHTILAQYFGDVSAAANVSTEKTAALPPSSDVVFDYGALSRRLRGRTDRMAELIHSFLAQLPDTVEKIQWLANEKSYSELVFSAHTLKGSAANLGAVQLQQAAASIERLSKQLQGVADELDEIALQDVVVGLEEMVATLKQSVSAAMETANQSANQ